MHTRYKGVQSSSYRQIYGYNEGHDDRIGTFEEMPQPDGPDDT